eukprot:CFRG6765T1
MVCDKCTPTETSEEVGKLTSISGKRSINEKRSTTRVLKAWLKDHYEKPYPSATEKEVLKQQTGLNLTQINYWFTNARRRYLPKMHVANDDVPISCTDVSLRSTSPTSLLADAAPNTAKRVCRDGSRPTSPPVCLYPVGDDVIKRTLDLYTSLNPSRVDIATGRTEDKKDSLPPTVVTAESQSALSAPGSTAPSTKGVPTIASSDTVSNASAVSGRATLGNTVTGTGEECTCTDKDKDKDKDTNDLERTMFLDFIVKCNAMRSRDGGTEVSSTVADNHKRKSASRTKPSTTRILRSWLNEHYANPYPDAEQKEDLCKQTGLSITQVNYWFVNARRRYLTRGRIGPPPSDVGKTPMDTKSGRESANNMDASKKHMVDKCPSKHESSVAATSTSASETTAAYPVSITSHRKQEFQNSDSALAPPGASHAAQISNSQLQLAAAPVYPVTRSSYATSAATDVSPSSISYTSTTPPFVSTSEREAVVANCTRAKRKRVSSAPDKSVGGDDTDEEDLSTRVPEDSANTHESSKDREGERIGNASSGDSSTYDSVMALTIAKSEKSSKPTKSSASSTRKHSDSGKVSTTNLLKGWLREHRNNPYPDPNQKEQLRELTGMSMTQINYWFTNARRRYLPQMQTEKSGSDGTIGVGVI